MLKSDDETIIYGEHDSSDESVNLSSDEFSSESDESDSDSEVLADVCVWCRVDPQQPSSAPPRFAFTGQPGLQFQLDKKDDPRAYLRLFLDDSVMDITVNETNRYAEQTLTRTSHLRLSRTRHGEPVTRDDIWRFF